MMETAFRVVTERPAYHKCGVHLRIKRSGKDTERTEEEWNKPPTIDNVRRANWTGQYYSRTT